MLPRAATVAVAVAAATIISNVDVTVDAVAAAKHINYYTIHYSSYNILMVLEPDILAAVARQFRPISPSRVFYKVRELPLLVAEAAVVVGPG